MGSGLLLMGFNNVLLPTLFNVIDNIVEPNCRSHNTEQFCSHDVEQCGQQNIVQSSSTAGTNTTVVYTALIHWNTLCS